MADALLPGSAQKCVASHGSLRRFAETAGYHRMHPSNLRETLYPGYAAVFDKRRLAKNRERERPPDRGRLAGWADGDKKAFKFYTFLHLGFRRKADG